MGCAGVMLTESQLTQTGIDAYGVVHAYLTWLYLPAR